MVECSISDLDNDVVTLFINSSSKYIYFYWYGNFSKSRLAVTLVYYTFQFH